MCNSPLGSARLLAIAFRDRGLCSGAATRSELPVNKVIAAECGDQHAASVRPQRAATTSRAREQRYVTAIMVTIQTIKNGPYIVTGEVELIDVDGNKFPAEKRMALCRCGASTEKPFCDGTHSKIGFQAAEKAVPESKE